MYKRLIWPWIFGMAPTLNFLLSCGGNPGNPPPEAAHDKYSKGTYGYDLSFLKEHSASCIELKDRSGKGAIILAPGFQGRVMTSTVGGDSGASLGWINYDLIASQKTKSQFNPVGGEERFWLGPEGGQFALFFKKGDSFNISHWQVPPEIDTVPYQLLSSDGSMAVFSRDAELSNYSGTDFHLQITRTIRLIDESSLQQNLKLMIPPDLAFIAYESDNQIKNTGPTQWRKDKGLVSIWLLGQMRPSDKTFVFIPFQGGADARNYITDDYFGKIPQDRLLVKDSVLYFKCDGKQRGKIGISPKVAASMAGSFDFEKNLLTIISYTVDKDGLYVNSKWEMQKQPYRGDVVNSYNDGPLSDGSQLGPFYEIESSSSAKELKPGESQVYKQMTCHFHGDYQSLRVFAKNLLGVDLEDLKKL
jgi:hypothetical protein